MSRAGERTLLGFDLGTKRTGVAIGQEVTRSVRPLTTLQSRNQKPDWDTITQLIEEWKPDLLIVGLPLQLDGTEQDISNAARRFGNQLKGRYNLPVEMVDERFSSCEAEELLQERARTGLKKQDKAAQNAMLDQVAAQLVLQSWLDSQ